MTKVNERSTVRLNVDTNESGEVVFHAATPPDTPSDAARAAAKEIARQFNLEKPGWVTVGRITVDRETETEKFERTTETATDRVAAIITRYFATTAAPDETAVGGEAQITAMWEALKREACKVPDEAQQIVFLGEQKFRKAMAPFVAPVHAAGDDAALVLLDKFVLRVSLELRDNDPRLLSHPAWKGLIDEANALLKDRPQGINVLTRSESRK